jgi:hypothetical protein
MLGEYVLGTMTPEQKKLLEDTRSLTVKLAMDRQEYLPGEVAAVKITVTNEKNQAIQVMKPFTGVNGGLDMLYHSDKAGPGLFGPCFMNSHREREIYWGGPVVWMAAWETQEITVSTLDQESPWDEFARGNKSVPREPGEYAAEYTLVPGSMVKFRVVPVVIEQIASGRLPDVVQGNRPDRQISIPRYSRAAVLQAGNQRFLVVTHGGRGDPRTLPIDLTREANRDRIREIAPFVRIAQLESAAQSLEISGPENNQLTVRCLETNGRKHAFLLDEQRKIVREEQ